MSHLSLDRTAPSDVWDDLVCSGILGKVAGTEAVYCILRPGTHPRRPLEDLDVLVAEGSAALCRAALEAEGFIAESKPWIPFKFTLSRYRRGVYVCLDVHTKLVQSGLVYMDACRALARRELRHGAYFLSPEDQVIHLVFHELLRAGRVRSGAAQRIGDLLNRPLDRSYLREHLETVGSWRVFATALERIQSGSLSDREARSLKHRTVLALTRRSWGNLRRHLRYRLRVPRRGRIGGLIAFVGPDGAGKSTTIAAMRERSHLVPGLKLATAYLGPWGQIETPWLRFLRYLGISPSAEPWGSWLAARLRRGDAPNGAPGTGRGIGFLGFKWLKSTLKGCLFYPALAAELWWRYVRRVLPEVLRGRWVLADRYVTDLRYLYKGNPITNHALMRFLTTSLYPRPDLFVLLVNQPDVIASRKSDLRSDQVPDYQRLYRDAVRKAPHVVLATDRSPIEIADRVLEEILLLRGRKAGFLLTNPHASRWGTEPQAS